MKRQAFNPYLPSWEYIPDGEPHLFDGRVYVYGSHDHFNAPIFCVGDYVCWSAPADDLSDWRYEGVIYRKNQDPKNRLGLRLLFAPDVTRGPDGRYYLYYAFDLYGMIGVAVCDTPAGHYAFHGWVRYADGTIWGRRKGDQFPFDPGVLTDDDGSVWLYSGFNAKTSPFSSDFVELRHDGGVVLGLEADMLTIRQEPKLLFPVSGENAFEDHVFFEASSIRKDGDRYIFVYSSVHNHELCYAVSDRPDGDFRFGGTLVSQGDLFLHGNTDERQGTNYLGNTHGGMLQLGDDWYIFYHRQTNRHSYSRQACAEKLVRTEDGMFLQAEVTSCGLNGGPLKGQGRYPARIACNLWSADGVGRYDGDHVRKKLKDHPYFTQKGPDREHHPCQYIANMRDGSVAGFKYFDLAAGTWIGVKTAGKGFGMIEVSDTPDFRKICASIRVGSRKMVPLDLAPGVHPLYFRFRGKGSISFLYFRLRADQAKE